MLRLALYEIDPGQRIETIAAQQARANPESE